MPRTARRDADPYAEICEALRAAIDVDFSEYRRATMRRRVARRMDLIGASDVAEYAARLRSSRAEARALGRDLLVHVTSFFRDPSEFELLKEKVYPALVGGRSPKLPVRVWVPACSTGEEAYSHAINLLEFFAKRELRPALQLFATDIDAESLARARAGFVPEKSARSLSPARLAAHFTKVDGGWRVSKTIRDLCVFAQHDVAKDPPFTNIDLLSCRNLLIYLEPSLQRKVLPIFHHSLRPDGFLMLGSADDLGDCAGRFVPVERGARVYSKAPEAPGAAVELPAGRGAAWAAMPDRRSNRRERPPAGLDFHEEVNRILLKQYTPAAVLVDDSMSVLQTHGDVRPYLELPSGALTANLVKMAGEDLAIAVRAALLKAKAEDLVAKKVVAAKVGDRETELEIDALPVRSHLDRRRRYLVLFRPAPERAAANGQLEFDGLRPAAQAAADAPAPRAVDDELEAAKEELQAINEELVTVNEELRRRNLELHEANGDLTRLLSSVEIPIVMLDRETRVRRATPSAQKVLGLSPADVGRPLSGLRLSLDAPSLPKALREVLGGAPPRELEARDGQGRWYNLSIRPCRSPEKKVDGAVVSLIDVTERRRVVAALEASRDYAEAILDTVNEAMLILDPQLRIVRANRSFYRLFQKSPEIVLGRSLYEIGNGRWNLPHLRKLLGALARGGRPFSDWEGEFEVPRLGRRTLAVSGRTVKGPAGPDRKVLLFIEDVTPRRQAAEAAALRKSEARQRDFVANVSHELMTPITAIKGYSEAMLAGALENPARRQKFTQIIGRNADRLAQLVEDILQLSAFDSGRAKARKDAVALRPHVLKLAQSIEPGARKRGISLRIKIPQSLRVGIGAKDLSRVLQNLLENAVKYNRPNGRVYVQANAVGKRALVIVQDTGIGVPKDDLTRIFDRFHRAHNAREKTERGTGLGLSIVKSILGSLGCRIWAESVEGKGTTFFFTLPLA